MKSKMLKAALLGLIMTVSGVSNAGLMYEFDLSSNTNSWGLTQGDISAAILTIEFADSVDFDDVRDNDVLGLTFSSAGVSEYFTEFQVFSGEMFRSWSGGVALEFDKSLGLSYQTLTKAVNGKSFYMAQAYTWSAWDFSHDIRNPDTRETLFSAEADRRNPDGVTVFGTIASVPEPSTIAIFALGIIGLSSRRL